MIENPQSGFLLNPMIPAKAGIIPKNSVLPVVITGNTVLYLDKFEVLASGLIGRLHRPVSLNFEPLRTWFEVGDYRSPFLYLRPLKAAVKPPRLAIRAFARGTSSARFRVRWTCAIMSCTWMP